MQQGRLFFFGVLIAFSLLASPARGQWVKPFKSDLYENNADLEKVSSPLLQARKMLREGKSRAQVQGAIPSVPFVNEQPEIEVRLKSLTPEIVDQMKAIGMNVTGVYYEYARVIGTCDPNLLDEVASNPAVRTVHPNVRPIFNKGAVTSQADTVLRADLARAEFGVDGSGVPIGIVSDSFKAESGGTISGSGCDRSVTGTPSQISGDAPAAVRVLVDANGEDEGRAMAELIYDLAPGAPLLFHTAQGGEPVAASAINALRACGAKVIVDDYLNPFEPMFQDGIIAQAAQAAVDAGVSYFSSAGNNDRVGVDAEFVDVAPQEADINFHDFGGGDTLVPVVLPPGCDLSLMMQWADPFDGSLGPGASSDFDLGLFSCAGGDCIPLDVSQDMQGCGTQSGEPAFDPMEMVSWVNPLPIPATVYVAVSRYCGSVRRFRIVSRSTCDLRDLAFDPAIFRGPQLYGHAAAKGAAAVAAIAYREVQSSGTEQPPSTVLNVEPFSSSGGNLPFFFTGAGSPLVGAPQVRVKPDLTAPDGTNTTFFGQDLEGDGVPNFSGTSAAAPHAAAVAALIRQKNPSLSPAEVLGVMTSTATDIESPGFDFLSGFGLIDALAAVGAAGGSTPTQGSLENPGASSFQSGIGLISGWVCSANRVTYRIDNGAEKDAAYGTSRNDTTSICGDANNGFGALINWNVLGDGNHTVRAYADGVEFGSATFNVTTLGVAFLQGASGQYLLNNFPFNGESVILRWQEGSQNFVISDASFDNNAAETEPVVTQGAVTGSLENPGGASFQSGIGVISGWVCSAGQITLTIDGGAPFPAAYGTSRTDTVSICGDANNGFGRLINWNLLGSGTHTVRAFADGMQFGEATFTVTTLGTNFLTGVTGQYLLPDFAGKDVTVRWQEGQQNFVIVGRQ